MAEWTFANGHEIAAAVSRGETSAQAVVESALATIQTRDQVLNAFTDSEHLRAQGRSMPRVPPGRRLVRSRACRSR